MSMRSARLRAFSALTQTLGLVSVELVYQWGIGLAAIAAGSAFRMKAGAGIILLLPVIVMMTRRKAGGAGIGADDEAIGVGGSTTIADSAIWAWLHCLVASHCSFTFFPVREHPFFCWSPKPDALGCSSLDFPFQKGGWSDLRLTVEILFADVESCDPQRHENLLMMASETRS